MSQSRRELLPIIQATSPAYPLAVEYLTYLRQITTVRGGEHELNRSEQVGCLPGVAAVLACEDIGTNEITIDAASKATSTSRFHFHSTLSHCRPLITSYKASKLASRSRSNDPNHRRSPRESAPRSPNAKAIPLTATQGERNPFLEGLLSPKRKVETPSRLLMSPSRAKVDLSGLRRNTPSKTVDQPEPTISLQDASPVASTTPTLPPLTSIVSTSTLLRTPSKPKNMQKPLTPSSARASPMHADLMKSRLETARKLQARELREENQEDGESGEESVEDSPSRKRRRLDDGIDEQSSFSTRKILGSQITNHSSRSTLPKASSSKPLPKPKYIPHLPISPYLSIPLPVIPLIPRKDGEIYPSAHSVKDRIWSRGIVPLNENGEAVWLKREGGDVDEVDTDEDGEDEEDDDQVDGETGLKRAEREAARERAVRRSTRRRKTLEVIIRRAEDRAENHTLEGESTRTKSGKKARGMLDWDDAFWIPVIERHDEQVEEEDESEQKQRWTWEDGLDKFTETSLPYIRSLIGSSSPRPDIIAESTNINDQKFAWIERAKTRGIAGRVWSAASD